MEHLDLGNVPSLNNSLKRCCWALHRLQINRSISRLSLEFPASDPKVHAVYGLFGDKPPTLKERIIMKCSARDSWIYKQKNNLSGQKNAKSALSFNKSPWSSCSAAIFAIINRSLTPWVSGCSQPESSLSLDHQDRAGGIRGSGGHRCPC